MAGRAIHLLRNTVIVIALLAALVAGFFYWCYADTIWRVETSDKAVSITYDDGPNPPYTEELLALLAREDVPATFFLKGRNVEAFPAIPRMIGEAGHEIGNHSYYHRPMWSFSLQKMRDEVRRVDDLLKHYPGYHPEMFRPPYGAQGPGLKRALAELGMTSVIFDAVGVDWEPTTGREIADRVLADVGPGSIILLHDGHGDTDDPHGQDARAATVEATAIIISELKARGYRFVVASELLALQDG